MPPLPKDPALRQRTNRTSTQATLSTAGKRRRMPPLPARTDGTEWDERTLAFWRDTWRSPMASEFLKADTHGLYILAELVEVFWREPTAARAAEIRLQRQCFGLTPIDRRRLQWEVERVESVTRKRPVEVPKPMAPADDPRRMLQVVQ